MSGCGSGVSGVSSGSVGSVGSIGSIGSVGGGGGCKKPKNARRGEDGVRFGAGAHFHSCTHS